MRNRNLWLTGIGGFTALIFGFLAFVNYQFYTFQRDLYYLAGMVVFGAIAALSVYAVINGWRNALPGQRAYEDDAPGADEPAD